MNINERSIWEETKIFARNNKFKCLGTLGFILPFYALGKALSRLGAAFVAKVHGKAIDTLNTQDAQIPQEHLITIDPQKKGVCDELDKRHYPQGDCYQMQDEYRISQSRGFTDCPKSTAVFTPTKEKLGNQIDISDSNINRDFYLSANYVGKGITTNKFVASSNPGCSPNILWKHLFNDKKINYFVVDLTELEKKPSASEAVREAAASVSYNTEEDDNSIFGRLSTVAYDLSQNTGAKPKNLTSDVSSIDSQEHTGKKEAPEEISGYYPFPGQEVRFGDVIVKCIKEKLIDGIGYIHTYEVRDDKGTTKQVKRLHVTDWIDGGVISVQKLHKIIKALKEEEVDLSFWVHCFKGIGRTGTLITAMILEERIERGEINNKNLYKELTNMVVSMRRERDGAFVQTKEQAALLVDYGRFLLRRRTHWQSSDVFTAASNSRSK